MTFLSPVFLWLLPLTSLPVIIHLLAKRRSKLIDFPSLKFLKLLEQDSLRKFNVKQLILLIIRTLMILLVILVFARPNLDVRAGFGLKTQSVDLMIIVLDNTASNRSNFASMSGSWLLDFGSELSGKGYKVYYAGITDFKLRDGIEGIRAEYAGGFSGDLVESLDQQIDLERYRQKTIIWLSDRQDIHNYSELLVGWDQFLLWAPVEYDVGISSLELPPRGLHEGEEYQVNIGLTKAGDHQETLSVELEINENRQNQVTVDANQSVLEMHARVADPGFQEGKILMSQDEQAFNDIRYFILPAAGKIPLQILRSVQPLDYWSLIEKSISEMELNINIRLLNFNEIDNLNLNQGGTVIVDDPRLLTDYNWTRLEGFIEQGGQLILFGDGGEHLRRLLKFHVPLIAETSRYPLGLITVNGTGSQVLGEPVKVAISQNRLKVYKRFDTGSGELDHTWVRFLDGQPFLGACDVLEGRIVWLNTEFTPESGNFPLLGIFPTLITRLVQSQQTRDMTSEYNAEIGDTLHFAPGASDGENTPFNIQRPDGTMDFQAPDSNYSIHYSQTDLPGVYKLMQGRKILEQVAVNISTHEAEAHSSIFDMAEDGLWVTQDKSELINEVLGRHSGTALWPLLLGFIVLLWILETYLSRVKLSWRQNV